MKYFQRVIIVISYLFISLEMYSQSIHYEIRGQVFIADSDASGVHVINLSKNRVTITNSKGEFQLEAQVNDTISFSLIGYSNRKLIITENIIKGEKIYIQLEESAIDLEEVIVKPFYVSGELKEDLIELEAEVSASSLNLPNADVKKMTKSERLLIEADGGKYINYYGLSLTINLHKIMNKVSGRTKSFEDMVARDENIELEKKIITKFSKETISEGLSIPLKNIDEFLTFCIFQKDFSELSEASSTMMIWEYLKTKSIEFKK